MAGTLKILAGGTARLDRWRELARRTTASAPHNASVIGDPAENWTGAEASAPIQLGANGQRNKNTRITFGTMNIGAHAKTHMRCTIVSQAFQERGQLF